MFVTCYILEDGSIAHPKDVARDKAGTLRDKKGIAVAMRGGVPRTRSVDTSASREMKPQATGPGYVTRDIAAGDPDSPPATGRRFGRRKPAQPAPEPGETPAETSEDKGEE